MAATLAGRPTGQYGVIYGGGLVLGGGCALIRHASAIGTIGTVAMLGGAIGVTGATMPIDRPFLEGPVPGYASVLVVVLPAAVLLAATALVRVAGASGRGMEHRSQRAAEEEPAKPRRLLAEPRDRLNQVRSEAEEKPARFDAPTCPRPV
ncbi:hypothetical protein ABGB18_08935 [Nonomuraea sp. B12E4]|uniref:hypothetical protein n=1 Tax=Nonomuraea sp. B12E4 TaxID=3153564 RepID=UPI00325F83BB